MSKKFLAALIILPILALGSYVALRLHQVKQAEQMAVLIDAEGGNVNFDDDKILFFIPSRKADSVHIDCASDRWREQFEGLRCFPKLRSLFLMGCPVKDKDLKLLSHLKDLKELDLSGTNVTDAGMAELARLPSLELLSVSLTFVSSDGVRQLPERVDVAATGSKIDPTTLPGRKLSVPEGPVPPDALITLCREFERDVPVGTFISKSPFITRGKPHLARIHFFPEKRSTQIYLEGVERIKRISEFADLAVDLYQGEANPYSTEPSNRPSFDATLAQLCKLELSELDLQSHILTPSQLDAIWGIETLEAISLRGKIPESISLPSNLQAARFTGCTNLKTIHLSANLQELCISDCPSLTMIDIEASEPQLERVDLHDDTSGCDLSFLTQCKGLQELHFYDSSGELDFDTIAKCTSLRRLKIVRSYQVEDLTDDQKQSLRDALPDTEIEFN